MFFGSLALDKAENAILAHTLKVGKKTFKKGRKLSSEDLSLLRGEKIETLICAKLEPGDIFEDDAADRITSLIIGENLRKGAASTGRTNIYADKKGLLNYEAKAVNNFNSINEAVTLGLVPSFQHVEKNQMIGTLKIIPFAISGGVMNEIEKFSTIHQPLFNLRPYVKKTAMLIQTQLTTTKASVLNSTAEVTSDRLKMMDAVLIDEKRCNHSENELSSELYTAFAAKPDIILIAGASAIVDRRDIVPSAIQSVGGEIIHFGMPVDPGNLILLASFKGTPVVGIPGCARSPKLNGFDWVLWRLMAGLEVKGEDIMNMGGGGLLKDIPSRPLPRGRVSRLEQ